MNRQEITIKEASAKCGLATWTLAFYARDNQFDASKPKGKRGGWVFDLQSFNDWLLRRRMKSGNAIARARLKREMSA